MLFTSSMGELLMRSTASSGDYGDGIKFTVYCRVFRGIISAVELVF